MYAEGVRLGIRQPCLRCPLYQLPTLHPLAAAAMRFWNQMNGDRAQREVLRQTGILLREGEVGAFGEFVEEVASFHAARAAKPPAPEDDEPPEE